jgi:hypothetical protein
VIGTARRTDRRTIERRQSFFDELLDPELPDPELPDPELPDPELPDPELLDPELLDPELLPPLAGAVEGLLASFVAGAASFDSDFDSDLASLLDESPPSLPLLAGFDDE